ncbi:unnamed protein product [Ectocarpus fasciculatus]
MLASWALQKGRPSSLLLQVPCGTTGFLPPGQPCPWRGGLYWRWRGILFGCTYASANFSENATRLVQAVSNTHSARRRKTETSKFAWHFYCCTYNHNMYTTKEQGAH